MFTLKKYDENRAFALLDKIGFTRVAGSSEELKAAEILKAECESFGLSAVIEPFEIESAEVEATFEILEPYRKSYTVRGYQCAESTAADGLTADFVYVENALPVECQGQDCARQRLPARAAVPQPDGSGRRSCRHHGRRYSR